MDKEDINYKKFNGDYRLKSRLVFERDTWMQCVFCGEYADTREHVPSKVLLNKPLPTDLPTLPSCKKCNNSYSRIEIYTKVWIEMLKQFYLKDYSATEENKERIKKHKEGEYAKISVEKIIQTGCMQKDDNIINTFSKIGICHAVYDLSIGYYIREKDYWKLAEIYYNILPFMNESDMVNFQNFEIIGDKVFPEIGSRGFDNIRVLEMILKNENNDMKKVQMLVTLWKEIQDNYRYITYLENDNIIVKIVVDEFFYCSMLFINVCE